MQICPNLLGQNYINQILNAKNLEDYASCICKLIIKKWNVNLSKQMQH